MHLPTGVILLTSCYVTQPINSNRENLVSPLYDLHICALKTDVRMHVAISWDPCGSGDEIECMLIRGFDNLEFQVKGLKIMLQHC